jgi:hypothetical protein
MNILVDWGNTIIRDADLFKQIAEKSGNVKTEWENPSSWNRVRSLGDNNHFDSIQDGFFLIGDSYPGAIEVISSFCGKCPEEDHVYIIFDNVPIIKKELDKIQIYLAESFQRRNVLANGFIVESNKIFAAKSYGINVAVDDDPRIAISLCLAGIKTIVPLRKWNRNLSLNLLEITMKEDKFNIVKENLIIAEDWYEIGIILGTLSDSQSG